MCKNMNLWNNKLCVNLEQTYEAYKFVMIINEYGLHAPSYNVF
jgi:hypothetical protein